MMPLDQRVTRLETGVDNLGAAFQTHSERIDEKLDSITTLLSSLVRVEERQGLITDRLAEGTTTMRDHEARLRVIEVQMPGLLEKARWITLGILGVLGLIGTAVVTGVLKV